MSSHSPKSGNRCAPEQTIAERRHGYLGEVVNDLHELVRNGRRFATIYADPPWPYENEASRAAAVRHYPVMKLNGPRNEPVEKLAAPNAHLHLWTTNAFLREALDLIDAWGFRYRSTFVWVKDEWHVDVA